MSEEQKIELLQTLWSVMRSFVEMGFKGDFCDLIFNEQAKALEADSGRATIEASIPEYDEDQAEVKG